MDDREANLLAAIARAAAGHDSGESAGGDAARLVYADFLQSAGDPRGELISVSQAANDDPRRAELETLVERSIPGLPVRSVARWDRGFVDTLDLTGTAGARETDAFLFDPALALLREVWVVVSVAEIGILEALATTTARDTLQRVHLRFAPGQAAEAIQETVESALELLPHLDGLSLGGRSFADASGTFDLLATVALDSLEVQGELSRASFERIATPTSSLTSLVIDYRRRDAWADVRSDLEPVLRGHALPQLRHIGVLGVEYTGEFLDALASSPLGSRLDRLTVNRNWMTAEARTRVRDRRDSYRTVRFVAPAANAPTTAELGHLLRIELERPAEAMALYAEALRIDPADQAARYGVAVHYRDVKDYTRSLDEIDRGLAVMPASPYGTLRSSVLRRMGRGPSAVIDLRQNVESDPRYGFAWTALGGLLRWFGRWDEALAALEKVRAIDPTSRWTDQEVAETLIDAGRGTEARVLLEPLIAATPNNWYLEYLLGTALIASDPEGALARFARIRELSTARNAVERSRFGGAVARRAAGDGLGALSEIDALVAATDCPSWIAFGWLLSACTLRDAGRATDAEAAFRSCAQGGPDLQQTADAIAARANGTRGGATPVHATDDDRREFCDPNTWDRINCGIVATIAAFALGDRAGAHACAALVGATAAAVETSRTRWNVWRPLVGACAPSLRPEDLAVVERLVLAAGTTEPLSSQR